VNGFEEDFLAEDERSARDYCTKGGLIPQEGNGYPFPRGGTFDIVYRMSFIP
jgi:hypothetical protein